MRAFLAMMSSPWVISEEGLDVLIKVALREQTATEQELEVLRAERGRPVDGSKLDMRVRDGIALIPVTGPIVPRASLFSQVSGMTSVTSIAEDLNRAAADPRVTGIIMEYDTPGGAVGGISELADMIRATSQKKPVKSYVGLQATSGGLWLASAAQEVIVHKGATYGSIGCIVSIGSGPDSKSVKKFRSDISPDKQADPDTPAGEKVYQQLADTIGNLFLNEVLNFRGEKTSREKILALRGGVVLGQQAVEVGLADRLGTLEGLIAEMSNNHQPATNRSYVMADNIKVKDTPWYKRILAMGEEDAVTDAKVTDPPAGASANSAILEARIKELEAKLADKSKVDVQAEAQKWVDAQISAKVGTPAQHAAFKDLLVQALSDDQSNPLTGVPARAETVKKLAEASMTKVDILSTEKVPGKPSVGTTLPADSSNVVDFTKTTKAAEEWADKHFKPAPGKTA